MDQGFGNFWVCFIFFYFSELNFKICLFFLFLIEDGRGKYVFIGKHAALVNFLCGSELKQPLLRNGEMRNMQPCHHWPLCSVFILAGWLKNMEIKYQVKFFSFSYLYSVWVCMILVVELTLIFYVFCDVKLCYFEWIWTYDVISMWIW